MPDGAAIRRARESKGWSQNDLAKRAKISQQYISLIENDQRPHASAAMLLRIAMTLEVAMETLMSEAERNQVAADIFAGKQPRNVHRF